MRLLLDTHAFLWWVSDSGDLSGKAKAAIADPANECFVSVASCWEMAIKISLGKLALGVAFERFVPEQLAANAFQPLDLGFRHVARVAKMAFHHRDPFDRVLAAQALEEKMALVSADPVFRRYGVKRVW
jgi:PIN domain nuclease of toxin-antitoxin system